MPNDKDAKAMTDEQLDEAMAARYGDRWTLSTVDDHDPLVVEFFRRLATGR